MDTEASHAQQRYTLVVRNTQSRAMTLFLEPAGSDYLLPPGETFEIRAAGPQGGHLEIDFAGDHVTTWAWPGSVVDLWQNGVNLSGPSIPVPSVPEGMTVRGFLGMVLGDSR